MTEELRKVRMALYRDARANEAFGMSRQAWLHRAFTDTSVATVYAKALVKVARYKGEIASVANMIWGT